MSSLTARLPARLRTAAPIAALAAVIYVPLLLTRPGRVGADTKSYLYLDPGRLLERAPSMWDPNIGMGTVTHQNIGYLWPIGPYYWLADAVGLPDWVAQRIWLGSILFAAGLGVRFLLHTLGSRGPHVTAASFLYALTPFVLTLGARLSVILLPYAGLPWLLALTVLALRRGGWRHPAIFGLVVATIGSVNATALLLVGVAPVLWILHEVAVARSVTVRTALATTARIGVMTVGCSLWWMAGLWAQRGWGIEILRFTETAETVATASLSLEVLRGLGYWFFYGEDRFGPWIAASRSFTQRVDLILLTYLIPAIGLLGAALVRFRERTYFLGLLVVGLLLSVGGHPWDDAAPAGRLARTFLESDAGLAMRSLPRAAPLVVLALAVLSGNLVAALGQRLPKLAGPAALALCVLAVLGLPPLWRGQMVDANLDRDEDLPSYWLEAAAALDRRDDGTRVLEIPGSDFASYRWGTTVDPVTPGLMDRPYVARELIPYGSPPSADLLNALDRRLQEQVIDPGALAPMARLMAAGDLVVRSDLTFERYNTPRPRRLWATVLAAPGLGEPLGFGGSAPNVPRPELPLLDEQELLTDPDAPHPPQVAVLPVEGTEGIVRTKAAAEPIVLAGDGEGIVDLASAGLITGHELLLYSATFADDVEGLEQAIDDGATLVLTDTNRQRARRWGTVRDNVGITERVGQEAVRPDPKDQRLELFPDAGPDAFTVVEDRGGVWADATSYGNSVSLTPEDDPSNAVDGERGTSWRVGGFSSATGETLRIHYLEPMTTDELTLLQAIGGPRNRFITEVDLRFDGGEPVRVTLDERSRTEDPALPGQVVEIGERTFSTLEITIVATDPGELRRYDGISSVGFAEVVAVDVDGTRPTADQVVHLPRQLLDDAGELADDRPLAIVITRERVAGTVAVRSDPERRMVRGVELTSARSFSLQGQVRLATAATDPVVDAALGLPGAEDGGVTASSKRRLPGGLTNRAMNAIDGDPDTWYSPGFLDQRDEYVDYELAEPLTFDRLDLTVLNDGRHSVPRVLRLEVDGEPVERIELPDIADQAEPNARHTFPVELDRSHTGTRITVAVERDAAALREVQTLDWFTGDPLTMPMGIVELGIPGLEAPPLPDQVDGTCRTDLVEVDGQPVPVQLEGTTEALLAGEPIDLRLCDDELALPEGEVIIETAAGTATGFALDRLVLRSDASGEADGSSGPLVEVDPADSPELEVLDEDRTSYRLRVPDAPDDFWLVLAQSHNLGWEASADGVDLGPPTLVNGYANGWRVPAGTDIDVRLTWAPQQTVRALTFASMGFVVLALVLALLPRGRRRPDATAAEAAAEVEAGTDGSVATASGAGLPQPLRWEDVQRYPGRTPAVGVQVVLVLVAAGVGALIVSPLGAAILAAAAIVGLRVPQSRPLVLGAALALFAGSVGILAGRQLRSSLPPGFDWPTYFDGLRGSAWTAVLLLALDPLIEAARRPRQGRTEPSSSPS